MFQLFFPFKGIFPGQNTGADCYFLLQGIFSTQSWNPPLLQFLHWQADYLPLSHQGSPHLLDYHIIKESHETV